MTLEVKVITTARKKTNYIKTKIKTRVQWWWELVCLMGVSVVRCSSLESFDAFVGDKRIN